MSTAKSIAKKVARHFVQPPWTSDVMEFEHGLWRGVSPLFTESGRQLGEENARPFLFNDHIPAKTIVCKYDDSRNGHPINMSALRIAMSNFDAALQITKAVIRYHGRAVSANGSSTRGGIWDLYLISLASIGLISYSIRKQSNKNSPAIVPDDLASQYQFTAGIFMICRDMIDTNNPLIFQNNPISAEQLYSYADEHKIFMSFNGMVCAGSTAKIMEFLEFCLSEMDAAFATPSTDEADTLSSPIKNVAGDLDEWYRYVMLSIELDCFIKVERRKSKMPTNGTRGGDSQQTIETYQGIADYALSLSQVSTDLPDGDFASGSLERQNKILSTLGRPPIRKIKRALVDEQLGFD